VKVLLINDFATIVGGAERFLENLLYEAQSSRIDFHRIDIAELVKVERFSTRTNFILDRYNRIRVIHPLVALISEKIEEVKPDLIHLNNNNLFTNTVLRSLQETRIPVVCFIHDYYAWRRLRSVIFIPATDKFIFLTHSPDIYQKMVRQGMKAHLVRVPFNPGKWAHSTMEEVSGCSADLLYVGRIEKAKGIFKLVRAVERLKQSIPSISLAILGEGSKLPELEKLVKKKNLTTNIRIRGFQRDDQIAHYYHHCRLLVFPSDGETLGYVGLEAQSSGIPVVAFANSGTTRWCKDNLNGFMIKGNSAQNLADKVLEIISDDVLLTRISTAARENIRLEAYNASKQKITDMYKEVLSW